ncbi:MAG: 50S ribosomal protein L10 [bacterium]|nr:50S ribosomal protein L10 [bacterium]
MAISKQKKEEIVDRLRGALKDAKSLVFVNFKGLTVGNTSEMRRGLKNEGVSYTVAKKTLTKRALDEAGLKGEQPALEGELALAWSEDLIAPARGVHGFAKKFPGTLKILGGIFDGEYKSQSEMEVIALIPGRQELRGMFVNIINSPIQRFAIALGEIAKKKV